MFINFLSFLSCLSCQKFLNPKCFIDPENPGSKKHKFRPAGTGVPARPEQEFQRDRNRSSSETGTGVPVRPEQEFQRERRNKSV
jgi:hypothetical protein